eukprot:513850-Pleurochrysis_carterae.AAC.1
MRACEQRVHTGKKGPAMELVCARCLVFHSELSECAGQSGSRRGIFRAMQTSEPACVTGHLRSFFVAGCAMREGAERPRSA